ncbi:MAG: ParB/RepB/Spo0J family partition protein [Myxococcales bacterium]|nr:ParB/RepB/Spo0J family partition protein [Myxococcales bacterium]
MGLDALLPASAGGKEAAKYGDGAVFRVPIERIRPAADQPRKRIDDARLEELAASIREHGVIEPVVVRRGAPDGVAGPLGDRYEIIAGERRWRASQRAGLKELVVVVKDVTPESAFELALVENLQREDLNPIETAEAYERLMHDHGYTQEELAARVGKSRPAVANALRLLKLPNAVRRLVHEGTLTEGHARALLGAPDEAELLGLAAETVRGRLSVRRVEALVRAAGRKKPPSDAQPGQPAGKSPSVRDLEHRLARRLGVRAAIDHRAPGGTVTLHYVSLDDLDRVLALLDPG